jgi:xylulokinase
MWLCDNEPTLFTQASYFILLKDYVAYVLTGKLAGDMSIATFSLYCDIHTIKYWEEMLDAIGINEGLLPPLIEPCSDLGPLLPEISQATGLSDETIVNIGTLDHFTGMIAVGNTQSGMISLSVGTVMALASFVDSHPSVETGLALHYGFKPGTYVVLAVSESGGVCLEWFRAVCLPEESFSGIDVKLSQRDAPDGLLFLPYITGVSAPEMDKEACGVFYGLRSGHDAYDMAYAVMEGVAHLLKKNCDALGGVGAKTEMIIATGGGAKSDLWCQLFADITGLPVAVPDENEASCLGAAIIGLVSAGVYKDYNDVPREAGMRARFEPWKTDPKKHEQFNALYDAMLQIRNML